MRLEDDIATFEMVTHYPSLQAARELIEGYLQVWEVYMVLTLGRSEIGLEFEDGQVIDRDPPPPGSPQVIYGAMVLAATTVAIASVDVMRRKFPDPPDSFVLSADAETMWRRYEMYRDGHAELISMAYFCLSVLEWSTGICPLVTRYQAL